MKNITLLSDTHNYLDERIFPYLEKCDEIWHAGDIGNLNIIDNLKQFAKTRAVYGNIDNNTIRKELNRTLIFRCEEIKILMTHIGGYPGKYAKGIKEMLKDENPDIFISGHSHILKVINDKELNILHMNPGAMGNHGSHKVKTMLVFCVNNNKLEDLKVIEYDR